MRQRTGHHSAFTLLAILGATVLTVELALADTVILRTGEVFSGKILRASREEVSIQLESGGILSFRASRVDRIRRERSSGGGPETIVYGVAEPPPAPSPPAVEQVTDGEGTSSVLVRPAGEQGRLPADLSSFPLRARKSTAPPPPPPPLSLSPFPVRATPDRTTPDRTAPDRAAPDRTTIVRALEQPGDRRFRDPQHGYSLALPVGFKPWQDLKVAAVVQGFIDPTTQANVTISVHDCKDSLDRMKDGIVTMLPRRSTAKVVRESRHEASGPGGYQGWILEMENLVAETTVRQLQLLAKNGGKVFIVTYSASAGNFGLLSRCFEESIGSFRFDGGKAELPPEVQSHLKKPLPPSPDRGPPPPEYVPEPGRPDVNRLNERIGARMRGVPLRPYTP